MNKNNIEIPVPANAEKHLHIISFDVPYPVDYGGVFDIFYKIKWLSKAGIKIHLHCFEYGRGQQNELEKYCAEIHYYNRVSVPKSFSFSIPYVIGSRANKALLANLKKDTYPILMEGMHCTYFLKKGDLPGSRCFVRLHNVEYEYYRQLALSSSSFIKKMYFRWESWLLKKYESSLANKATFWSMTDKDMRVFTSEFGYKSIDTLSLFLPEYSTEWVSGRGNYCLYHGNLSVPENEKVVIWLLKNVFHELDYPLVIAGKNPSKQLEQLSLQNKQTCIVANPTEVEMQELIDKAQINILPSLNNTGIKLKLINALYNGRHCLVNTAGVEGSGLDAACIIANSAPKMQDAIRYIFDQPVTEYTYNNRIKLLRSIFNNEGNAKQMISWIFGGEETKPGGRKVIKSVGH